MGAEAEPSMYIRDLPPSAGSSRWVLCALLIAAVAAIALLRRWPSSARPYQARHLDGLLTASEMEQLEDPNAEANLTRELEGCSRQRKMRLVRQLAALQSRTALDRVELAAKAAKSDPEMQVACVDALGLSADPHSLEMLIGTLAAADLAVALRAEGVLSDSTGRFFVEAGMGWDETVRERAVEDWTRWWESNKKSIRWDEERQAFVVE